MQDNGFSATFAQLIVTKQIVKVEIEKESENCENSKDFGSASAHKSNRKIR